MRVYGVNNHEAAPTGSWYFFTLAEARTNAKAHAAEGGYAGITAYTLARPSAQMVLACLNHERFAERVESVGSYEAIIPDCDDAAPPYPVRWVSAAQEEQRARAWKGRP